MTRLPKTIFALFTMLYLIPAIALAQDDQCLALIQAALESADLACSATGRNQLCFGSATLQAEPQAGFAPFIFSQPGNVVNAREIQTLHSSPFDAASGEYGVALLRIQASLPDPAPQNVSLLLFGDVELQNAVSAADVPPALEITVPNTMNIRSAPSTEAGIIGNLNAGQSVTTNGRLGDNTWLRIILPGDSGWGWVYAPLVTSAGDITTLDIVDSSGTPVVLRYGAMQSFTFRSGVDDAPCVSAPESGILLQVPADVGNVTFLINGVEVRLNGTVFLQADNQMIVSALEGTTRVGALGVTHVLLPGMQARIPLDTSHMASAAPLEPEPYHSDGLPMLPLGNLEREIILAPAFSSEQIAVSGIPTPGEWVTTYTILTLDCADGRSDVEERHRSNPITLQVEQGGAALVLLGTSERDDPPFGTVTLVRMGTGFYTASVTLENASGRQPQYQFALYVLAPDHIEGVTIGLGGDCTTTGSFTAELVTPVLAG